MPKAILEFDLENPDDRQAFAVTCRAQDLLIALETLSGQIRNRVKHSDPDQDKNISGLEEARKMLWDIIRDYDLESIMS